MADAPGANEAVFGAFVDGALAGVAGIRFGTREKTAHRAALFGLYVPQRFRKLGLGRGLVDAILTQAKTRANVLLGQLTVTAGNTPGKWSIREVVNHPSDTERLIVFRAFWFARGLESSLPSCDQTIPVSAARADDRSWRSLAEEFRAVRAASLAFFRSLPAEAWARRGFASDNPFTLRALADLAVGHVTHHSRILRERYLPS